jgi:large subunit ribosomal protein L15
MRLNDVKSADLSRKRKKRRGIGPGSGHGKSSGRGMKGFRARAGSDGKAHYEGGVTPLSRRFPKRGFNNPFGKRYTVLNVSDLEEAFIGGDVVTVALLRERRLISKVGDGVKVLGNGELTKALSVQAHKFSRSAVVKIQAAGGSVQELA